MLVKTFWDSPTSVSSTTHTHNSPDPWQCQDSWRRAPPSAASGHLAYCKPLDSSSQVHTKHHQNWASLLGQLVKNLPAMWKTWVRSLGWEDPLEEGMAIHSSILAWRIPKDFSLVGYNPWVRRVGHNKAQHTSLKYVTHISIKRGQKQS